MSVAIERQLRQQARLDHARAIADQQAVMFPDLERSGPMVPPPAMTTPRRKHADDPTPTLAPSRDRHLAIRVGTEVTLVGVETVRAVRGGVDAESISAMVDLGEIRWVWDVCTRGSRRELRFLAAEIVGGRTIETEDEAIQCVLGGTTQRARWRAAQVEQMWVVSAQTILRLGRIGLLSVSIEGRTKWVTRESLVAFLRSRLVRV